MSRGDKRFWIVCSTCRRRLGIEPKWVRRYLDRLLLAVGQETEIVASLLDAAQSEVEKASRAEKERPPSY